MNLATSNRARTNARLGEEPATLRSRPEEAHVSARRDRVGRAGDAGAAALLAAMTLGACSAAEPAPLDKEIPAAAHPPEADPERALLADVEWVPVGSVNDAGRCFGEGGLGAPGGDAGEIVLALAALEEVRGAPLSDASIDDAVAAYAASHGHLHVHTDAHALAAMRDALDDEGSPADVARSLRHPGPAADVLADAFVEHVGCAHLRSLLAHPAEQGVRAELVEGVLRAVLRAGWSSPEGLDVGVTRRSGDERVVATVTLDQPLTESASVPRHRAEGDAVLAFHPALRAHLRRDLAQDLARGAPALTATIDVARWQEAIDALGARQGLATVRHLAREARVFDVRFGADHVARIAGPNPSLGCANY